VAFPDISIAVGYGECGQITLVYDVRQVRMSMLIVARLEDNAKKSLSGGLSAGHRQVFGTERGIRHGII